MNRTPLLENYSLHMENGGEYIIKKMIAEGGFSLIYEAETAGGTTPVVIKEYYPAEGAFRNEQNQVCPLVGFDESFYRNLTQFNNEGKTGGKIARFSFQTVPFLSCGNGYAIMQKESEDMVSIADLVGRWSEKKPIPFTGNPKDADPVFTDLVRLKYSLRIVENVLSALATIHKNGFLHLDISSRNIIWAGADQDTGRNCAAFIADYGCAVSLSDGSYQPGYQMSYSPGFAAPEIQRGMNVLTPATDIYSVGMLLFFLCVGDSALEITRNRKRQVIRETSILRVPQRFKEKLQELICTAISEKESRFQSAIQMQEAIRKLDELIPLHPVNPDNTCSFTLFSLKSMMEGSRQTHYSWIHELCDRRKMELPAIAETVFEPLTWNTYSSDYDFLCMMLPEELFDFIKRKIDSSSNKQECLQGVMSGNYPCEWKADFCRIIQRYGFRRLLEVSRTALDNETAFFEEKNLLFQIIGKEGERLQECYYNITGIRKSPYIGLAMLTVYSLLGPDGFEKLIPSPSKVGHLLSPL